MDKPYMRFLVSVLTGILETETEKLKEIFKVSKNLFLLMP